MKSTTTVDEIASRMAFRALNQNEETGRHFLRLASDAVRQPTYGRSPAIFT